MWSKICVVAVAFSVCVFVPDVSGQAAGPYVVFWNLENFFDTFDDSLTMDEEFTPTGDKHWTWKKFLVKRNLIAKVLLSMHDSYGDWPLAVGFAEVENRMVLRQLTERTPLAKLGYGVVHRCRAGSRIPCIFSSITGLRSSAARSTPALSVRLPPILSGGW